MTNYS